MRRFAGRMNGEQYLGNVRTRAVHDLDHEDASASGCRIDAIIEAGHDRPFSSLPRARGQGYSLCLKCAGGAILSCVRRSCAYWGKRLHLPAQDEEEAVCEGCFRLVARLRQGFEPRGNACIETLARQYARWATADVDEKHRRPRETVVGKAALERVPDPRRSPDFEAEAAELLEEFWHCVERLPPLLRQRIKAYLLSTQEVRLRDLAAAAGVSEGAFAQSVVNARRDILRCMQKKGIF